MSKSSKLFVKKTKPYLVSASLLVTSVTVALIGEIFNCFHFGMYQFAWEFVYFVKAQLLPFALLLFFLSIWLHNSKIIRRKIKIVSSLVLVYLSVVTLKNGLQGIGTIITKYFSFRVVLALMVTILTSLIMLVFILLIVDKRKRTGIVIIVCSGLLIPAHGLYALEELHDLINNLYPNTTSWGFFLSDFANILLYSALIIFVCAYTYNECRDDC